MDSSEVIRKCREIVEAEGITELDLSVSNALDFFDVVKDVLSAWPREKLANTPWMKDFTLSLRKLRDDFEEIVRCDPACLYKPAHHVALEFHQSLAKVRYFYGGNGISKTQAGSIDDYWVVTSQHPYRPKPPSPTSVFIVGVNFTKYKPEVFEKKWLHGEPGNVLSPLLPIDGKWFYHYNERERKIQVACPPCAEAGKAQQCKHPKSSIILFSDNDGAKVLQGGRHSQGHLDEQIQEEFFSESMERLKIIPNSGMIVTETPLYGKAWWTFQKLYQIGSDPKRNTWPGSDKPMVSLHTIDQYAAGLSTKEQIDMSAALYSEVEKLARIWGKHVSASEQAIFDLVQLNEMRAEVKEPRRGYLTLPAEKTGLTAEDALKAEVKAEDLIFEPDMEADLRVWEPPSPYEQYIIGVDVAKGLTKGDASAACVFKVRLEGSFFHFTLVAQYHGWINPVPYAAHVFKLGLWYNQAPIVVERNGPGDSVIYQLVNELHCWFVLQDIQNPAQVRIGMNALYGVDTNVTTKGMMISMLQNVIKDRASGRRSLECYCEETISELENYIQERSQSGNTFTFKGIGNAHDDRVMAAAVAVYAVKTFPTAYSADRALELNRAKLKVHRTQHNTEFWRDVRKDLNATRSADPLDP
jgi:hypothetical protein